MTETIETTFGNATTDAKITPEAVTVLKEKVIEAFHLSDEEKDKMKQEYVDVVNTILTKPDLASRLSSGMWLAAARSIRARYQGRRYAVGRYSDYDFMPFSVTNPITKRPKEEEVLAAREKGTEEPKVTYSVRVYGLISSATEDDDLSGPATVAVTGFEQKESAQQFADGLRTRVVYRVKANVATSSPSGRLVPGQTAFLFANSGTEFESAPVKPEDTAWANALSTLVGYYPPVEVAKILTEPQANVVYNAVAEIMDGKTGVKDGRTWGLLRLSDGSMSQELLKQTKGLSVFLSSDDAPVAAMPSGSQVSVLLQGYYQTNSDKEGNATGDGQWRWNALAVEPLIDLSGGSSVPQPDKVSIVVGPQAPKPRRMADI